MIKTAVDLHTDGRGYWSRTKAAVHVTKLALSYVNDEGDFGELRVYFDRKTWDVNKNGLIYTDNQFLKELRKFLNEIGLKGADVDYSEQGMQGDDYVSCDVGGKFVRSWNKAVYVLD